MSQFCDFFLSLNGTVAFAAGLGICLVWEFIDRKGAEEAVKQLDHGDKDDPYGVFRSR